MEISKQTIFKPQGAEHSIELNEQKMIGINLQDFSVSASVLYTSSHLRLTAKIPAATFT